MKLHLDELELARAYDRSREFEELDAQQLRLITARARELFKWFRAHPRTHNLINSIVILGLLVADAWALLGLPRAVLADGRQDSYGWFLLAGIAAGSLHSWIGYSLVLFSIHEGAAHNIIVCGTGAIARTGQWLARNLCRLAGGDPDYYSTCHMAHHAKFGTEHDSEFLNFVLPHRCWMALIPLAVFINFSDFVIHRPLTYTRSRVISSSVNAVYQGTYAYLLYRSFGVAFALLTMVVFVPHVGFYLDRLRQFTEHNLMPLENPNGARSFGVGFWGLLLGGGPWGQPCHLAHHLAPGIPWYQQIMIHFQIKRLMTDRQREQFLLTPVTGFPRVLWHVVRDANAFAQEQRLSGGIREEEPAR